MRLHALRRRRRLLLLLLLLLLRCRVPRLLLLLLLLLLVHLGSLCRLLLVGMLAPCWSSPRLTRLTVL